MATYSDPYEQFKQAHGGSAAGYVPPAAAPAPAPAAPTSYPPPPGGANIPMPTGAQPARPAGAAPAPPGPGTYSASNPAGVLNTTLGNGKTIEQQFAAQKAGDSTGSDAYRDPAYSQAQWGAWEAQERGKVAAGQSANQTPNKYNPNGQGCPGDKPFTSRPGPDGGVECAAKPDDCPDGSHVVGTPGKCVPNGAGGAGGPGGGAGGAGGGGGALGALPSGAGAGSDLSSLMEGVLKGGLQGTESRYNPAAMQGLLAAIKSRTEGAKAQQIKAARAEAAGRGMARSGASGTNIAAIRSAADNQFTQQYGQVLQDKINADHQDKLDALDRSQKYLDSLRDELYRRDMSAIQRQQFQANLDLAYANLANQRQSLASQQQYGKDMLAAQYGYAGTFGG